jgi:DNA-binding CsgD family transcriptional regulator
MAKNGARNGKKNGIPCQPSLARVRDLIRTLVAVSTCAAEPGASSPEDNEVERVVIDTDIDGSRYQLIKMPNVERRSPPLSPRELEIVRMVAQGHQNKIIAAVLNISSWTVCTHVRRIFAKLGVNSRAAMVARLTELNGHSELALRGKPRMPGGAERTAASRVRTQMAGQHDWLDADRREDTQVMTIIQRSGSDSRLTATNSDRNGAVQGRAALSRNLSPRLPNSIRRTGDNGI